MTNRSVIQWLLDSDPSIRWQVMRDLTDASEEEVAAERARVATEGWGAHLLSLQGWTGRGLAQHGITDGIRRCTSCGCFVNLVSIPQAMRRAVR